MEATERVVIQLFSHVNVRGPSHSPHMDQHRSWDSGHSAILNLSVKVLDFVQFGGPKWMVGGTIFEMWLGSL